MTLDDSLIAIRIGNLCSGLAIFAAGYIFLSDFFESAEPYEQFPSGSAAEGRAGYQAKGQAG